MSHRRSGFPSSSFGVTTSTSRSAARSSSFTQTAVRREEWPRRGGGCRPPPLEGRRRSNHGAGERDLSQRKRHSCPQPRLLLSSGRSLRPHAGARAMITMPEIAASEPMVSQALGRTPSAAHSQFQPHMAGSAFLGGGIVAEDGRPDPRQGRPCRQCRCLRNRLGRLTARRTLRCWVLFPEPPTQRTSPPAMTQL
jgi:hypothetical protein